MKGFDTTDIGKVLVSMFLVCSILVSCAFAQNKGLDINIQIIGHEIKDAYVVGDNFNYIINLTNKGNESVNDSFIVTVFNPPREIVSGPKEYYREIEPNTAVSIKYELRNGTEVIAIPFDIHGDYKIWINSTQQIDFYRRYAYEEGGRIHQGYNRQTKSYEYCFDVMPRWEYALWKKKEEVNNKIIKSNEELRKINEDMRDINRDLANDTITMKNATIIILFVSLINLLVVIYGGEWLRGTLRTIVFLIMNLALAIGIVIVSILILSAF